jgi:ABC-type Fe3+/spermidine/putrescine transport system ATPase subunit
VSGAVLRFEDVTYRYGGAPAPSLSEVSLSVAPGEFVVVAGLSASGKSTLLRGGGPRAAFPRRSLRGPRPRRRA